MNCIKYKRIKNIINFTSNSSLEKFKIIVIPCISKYITIKRLKINSKTNNNEIIIRLNCFKNKNLI